MSFSKVAVAITSLFSIFIFINLLSDAKWIHINLNFSRTLRSFNIFHVSVYMFNISTTLVNIQNRVSSVNRDNVIIYWNYNASNLGKHLLIKFSPHYQFRLPDGSQSLFYCSAILFIEFHVQYFDLTSIFLSLKLLLLISDAVRCLEKNDLSVSCH